MKGKSVFRLVLVGMALALPVALSAAPATKPVVDAALKSRVEAAFAFDTFVLFVCAVLVIFMQTGFAMLTAGLSSAKNATNVLFKNFMDMCVAVMLFGLIGFSLMYPGAEYAGKWFGFSGFGISAKTQTFAELVKAFQAGDPMYHPQVDFLFQVAFAGAAATIVAGSVAGRMKFAGYLIYSAILTGLVYPISGMWKWGGGWLAAMEFQDFAGSLVVHSVGGFAGLAGAILLGPRIGKFGPDGKPKAMPGHNLALAALGTFILWLGWYGFNPGSQLTFRGIGNMSAVVLIAVNTTFAAAAGGIVAMLTTWGLYRKPELSMALNGALAGLVAITANCDRVTNGESVFIGAVGGVLVVVGVKLLDMLKIDDPVGAWPVHGLNGIWGGLATGFFGDIPVKTMTRGQFIGIEALGSFVYPLWAFVTMFIVFYILKVAGLLRVSRDEELKGLDISEHGEEAYNGFQIYTVE